MTAILKTAFFLALVLCLGPVKAWGKRSPSAMGLPFEVALEKMLDRSLDIEQQRVELEKVREGNTPDTLAHYPTIAVRGQHGSFPTRSGDRVSTRRDLSATATMNLYQFGADTARTEAAQLEESAQATVVDAATFLAEKEAANVIFDAILARKEYEVGASIASSMETLQKATELKHRSSMVTNNEFEKVTVDAENARSSTTPLAVKFLATEAALNRFLGNERIVYQWPWKEELLLGRWKFEDINKLFAQRPDWIAAQKRVAAIEKRADQSWSETMPSLDLNLTGGYGWNVTDSFQTAYMGGTLTLTVPLFDRYVASSKYKTLLQTKKQAELDLERVRRQALSEWDGAHRAFLIVMETLRSRENTLSNARALYEKDLRRLGAGLISANDLVLDQKRASDAELSSARAWRDAHSLTVSVCHAVGARLSDCFSKFFYVPDEFQKSRRPLK